MPFFRGQANSSHKMQTVAGISLWQAVQLLQKEGWRTVTLRGNQCQIRTKSSPIPITVAGYPHDVLAPGALLSLIAHHALIQIGDSNALRHHH